MKGFLLLFAALIFSQDDSCRPLFEERRFREVLDCVEARLRTEGPAAENPRRALELGALSAYLLEDFDGSARYFDRLLLWNPAYTPDPAELPPELVNLCQGRIALRNRSPWRFAPFGVGQWKQGRNSRALLYAGAGITALGINIGAYHIRRSRMNDDGTYDRPGQALNLYNVQQGALLLTAVVGVASVLDALFLR